MGIRLGMTVIKRRILILDDEEGMCNSLRTLLVHVGYDVVTATDIESGIKLLSDEFFDIVVLDIVFPDGNGLEAMDYCREFCPKTKVIAITGYASLDSATEALRRGVYDYVTKPFDFDLLHHAIEGALNHQRMEDEILYARQSYQSLIDNLSDGYLVLDQGRITYVNPRMARLFRCAPSTLIGRRLLDLVDPSDRELLKSCLDAISHGKTSSTLKELKLKDFKGNHLSVEMKFSTSRDYDGNTIIVAICKDITDRDVLWNQLIKAEKLALIGEMAAGIAHELNNKLTPILGYTEMMVEHATDEAFKRRLNVVHSSAIGAKSIVESLLLFSRQEKPRKSLCDVNEMVRNVVELVSSSFRGSDVRLEMDLAEEIPPVTADSHQIEQVLANIMKNAYEVLPKGGRIDIETLTTDGDVIVSVKDNGPGIPSSIRPHIFDPFFTTKERGKGTGLGLSVCRGIIQEHNGDIAVCSKENEFTTFSFSLPAGKPQQPPGKHVKNTPSEEDLFGQHRILIVEDEPDIAKLLQEVLSENFETDLVSNGEEAVQQLDMTSFDLIVSDVKMPRLDGIDLYHHLAEKAPEYCQRIIYTTGMTSDRRILDFLKKTGVPYLQKPFNVQDILDFVHWALSARLEENPLAVHGLKLEIGK